MGFDCTLHKVFSFIYKVKFEQDGLFEHEFDHVFIGQSDATPIPNPQEVADIKWLGLKELSYDIQKNPKNYTYWFSIALKKLIPYFKEQFAK